MNRAIVWMVAVAALVAAPGCSGRTGPAEAPGGNAAAPLAGGWSDVVADDPQLRDAAAFAARAIGGEGASVVAIANGRQQVVAGMNYAMEISLADGGRWRATVWRRLDGGMELTEAKRLEAAAPAAAEPKLTVEPGGLALRDPATGKVTTIAFDTAQGDVMAALAFRGPAGETRNDECGAGPTDFASWPDGLNLLFMQGRFVGWSLDERADTLAMGDGIAIGSSEAQLGKAARYTIEDSSLGREFLTEDGVSGIVDGGKVSALWAGASCVFR